MSNNDGLSPYARKVYTTTIDARRPGNGEPYGLLVHTTGRNIVAKAHEKMSPFGEAIKYLKPPRKWDVFGRITNYVAKYYARKKYSVHFVGGYAGCLYQISPDLERGWHAGTSGAQRRDFLSGRWAKDPNRISPRVVEAWRKHWTKLGYKSPQHLFPNRSPNDDYVGIELPPAKYTDKNGKEAWVAEPMRPGLWFTRGQHLAVILLALDLKNRYNWPDTEKGNPWWLSGRLVGHEDVNPYTRPGWDPGGRRKNPWFDWEYVYYWISKLDNKPTGEVFFHLMKEICKDNNEECINY